MDCFSDLGEGSSGNSVNPMEIPPFQDKDNESIDNFLPLFATDPMQALTVQEKDSLESATYVPMYANEPVSPYTLDDKDVLDADSYTSLFSIDSMPPFTPEDKENQSVASYLPMYPVNTMEASSLEELPEGPSAPIYALEPVESLENSNRQLDVENFLPFFSDDPMQMPTNQDTQALCMVILSLAQICGGEGSKEEKEPKLSAVAAVKPEAVGRFGELAGRLALLHFPHLRRPMLVAQLTCVLAAYLPAGENLSAVLQGWFVEQHQFTSSD
ncbi:uncharacterized protein LOC123253614 [Gracilinanus agilis]|uniref:uncharacterized protein LOC123253614 n=1 Tax=Gracilinanus agilis TaxID=191870 RepID=UPI001CFCC84B|nr:uncharacterized protein LOC123253614 [Gracilinanus agilis]